MKVLFTLLVGRAFAECVEDGKPGDWPDEASSGRNRSPEHLPAWSQHQHQGGGATEQPPELFTV